MQVDVGAFHNENNCVSPIFQYSWQHSDAISRDELALAIYEAEVDLADYLGYWPAPKWEAVQRVELDQPHNKSVWHAYGIDVRGDIMSVHIPKAGHFISGGRVGKTLIDEAAPIVYTDPDGDTYDELATITATTSVTDPEEIAIYYQGMSGNDEWEIRPITVSISAGVATITCRREQLVKKSLLEAFVPGTVEGTTDASFESTVDVYRKYHDPSMQVQLVWRNATNCCTDGTCGSCSLSIQNGCLTTKDKDLGIVTVSPGDWNDTDAAFDSAEFSVCRRPDYVRVWYRAGYRDMTLDRPNNKMSREWELAIAKLAVSKIDRNICGCKHIQDVQARWNTDYRRSVSTRDKSQSLRITQYELENAPFGTTVAALDVWRLARRRGLHI